jgi:signal transduction histidine kinase/CheY-like chemotaxis protein
MKFTILAAVLKNTLFKNVIEIYLILGLLALILFLLFYLKKQRDMIKHILSDTTLRKLSSNYSISLIEAIRDPLFAINTDFTITDMNNASILKTEVSRLDMTGTDFTSYFTNPANAKTGCIDIFQKGFISDYPLILKDGQLTDVLLSGSVYKDELGNVAGAVIVARDITEQKNIEKEFIKAKVIAESAAIVAEEAVKTKQQFLSNMSHEIRTPMNAIIGFTKVILKTELSEKQREYLTAIKLSGDALIVLINDILDLAKVDAGKMVFEKTPFKMETSILAMLHLFERKIQEKNIELVNDFDIHIPKMLIGDPVRLHQIIINLLSNAIKFTSKGQISLGVHLVKETINNVTIEFSVADTGIGIVEENIDKIFENFQQATTMTSRIYGGTGLGLAIVKQLVERQGGEITVKSKPGEGSVFKFKLDFTKTKFESLPESEIITLDPDLKNIKVLAVEDMALNQLLMKTLLDDFGFDRDIAANGKIAIEKMQEKQYDIILMDLQMPEMNGFEATEYIRKVMGSSIPIIALTADVTTVDLAKCKAAGMNDYIAKPVDEKLLYSKIASLLKDTLVFRPQMESVQQPLNPMDNKYINLEYLLKRTKSDPVLMIEMISLYLEQTPPLIVLMKESYKTEDWETLQSAVHKMIPSFNIMGIHPSFELIAKKVKEYAEVQMQYEDIPVLIAQLEMVCIQACAELTIELNAIKQQLNAK